MTKKPKTAVVAMRLTPDLKKAAEKAAIEDQRTLTSLIEKALVEYLREKGYVK